MRNLLNTFSSVFTCFFFYIFFIYIASGYEKTCKELKDQEVSNQGINLSETARNADLRK
jgi:hypothetical protein